MNILLVGEYSRLHNSLKEGLIQLGHNVLLIGNGDGFKSYPVDIKLDHSFHHPLLKKIKVAFYKITTIDLGAIEIYLRTLLHKKKLKNFDVVQLINEYSIKSSPQLEIKFLRRILKHNDKLFLLSSGVDSYCMKYMIDDKPKYSLMSAYLKDSSLYKTYMFQLQYLLKKHMPLKEFIYNNCKGIIASDIDYHLPLLGNPKYLGLIPNPINTDKIEYIPITLKEKIKIFHGINTASIHKKGNNYFNDAIKIIQEKYSDRIEIKTTHDIPYNQYIKLYDECHILLDQVYGYDQGYNALEAMAKGKVVFTGAEQEWLDYYNLKPDTVVINALPDTNAIVEKLEWLILNPKKIIEISKNARNFIEKEHNYKLIAQKYLNLYQSK